MTPSKSGEDSVIAILYQGVGSSGTVVTDPGAASQGLESVVLEDNQPQAFLVSSYFFSGSSYRDYGNTIFAHEFGHILGLEDSYDLKSDKALDDGIMGSGRFRPLSATYLSLENKKKLGLSY